MDIFEHFSPAFYQCTPLGVISGFYVRFLHVSFPGFLPDGIPSGIPLGILTEKSSWAHFRDSLTNYSQDCIRGSQEFFLGFRDFFSDFFIYFSQDSFRVSVGDSSMILSGISLETFPVIASPFLPGFFFSK